MKVKEFVEKLKEFNDEYEVRVYMPGFGDDPLDNIECDDTLKTVTIQ